MEIKRVETDKKRYLDLLLLADEQEDMVDRYLERGTMYVLEDGGVKAECVVTDEGDGILELKNIAVAPDFQGRGYCRISYDILIIAYNRERNPELLLHTHPNSADTNHVFQENHGRNRE